MILRKNTAPALCKHQKQHEMWVNEILLNMYFVSCTMIPEAIRQLNWKMGYVARTSCTQNKNNQYRFVLISIQFTRQNSARPYILEIDVVIDRLFASCNNCFLETISALDRPYLLLPEIWCIFVDNINIIRFAQSYGKVEEKWDSTKCW